MGNKILYFAYGNNREPEIMQALTGNKNMVGDEATLKGYVLGIQRLDQVPRTRLPGLPISPYEAIKRHWSDSFESYVIKKGEGEVKGMVWELTPEERELVRDWELIDLGWYKDAKGEAILANGKKVEIETYALGDNQEIDKVVDGREYNSFLSEPENFLRVIEIARREYFERRRTKEGDVVSKEAYNLVR